MVDYGGHSEPSRGFPLTRPRGGAYTDDSLPAIEDTFILGGQPFIYTEQDWAQAPGVARRAYAETSSALAVYQTALQYRSGLVENGRLLTQEQIGFRVMEFLGGLTKLEPHVTTTRCAPN